MINWKNYKVDINQIGIETTSKLQGIEVYIYTLAYEDVIFYHQRIDKIQLYLKLCNLKLMQISFFIFFKFFFGWLMKVKRYAL